MSRRQRTPTSPERTRAKGVVSPNKHPDGKVGQGSSGKESKGDKGAKGGKPDKAQGNGKGNGKGKD